MKLSRWELWQVYTTYLRCELDVDAVVERLVAEGLASVAMSDEGRTWIASEGGVTRGVTTFTADEDGKPQVVYAPETGDVKLLSGVRLELWADACAFLAADRKLIQTDSDLMRPCARLFLGEWRLSSDDGTQEIVVYPVLKVHSVGILHLSFRVFGPDREMDLAHFIENYRCLSSKRFSAALAPVRFPQLQPVASSLWEKRPNWLMAKLLSYVARDHAIAVRGTSGLTNDGDFPHRLAEFQGSEHSLAELFHGVVGVVALIVSEMSVSRWERLVGGPGIARIIGGHWCSRPHIHLLRHDQQEDTASADVRRNNQEYAAIMDGVASSAYRGPGLTGSLRPFEDHSAFATRAAVLWALSGQGARDYLRPADLNNRDWTLEAQVKGELIEYGHMLAQASACEALDPDALHSLREQRRLLTIQHSMLQATPAGEIQDLLGVAWERLGVPALLERAEKAFALSAAESTERLGQAEARNSRIYTVMFGVLAAPALADALIFPAVEAWLGVEATAIQKLPIMVFVFAATLATALLVPFTGGRKGRRLSGRS